MTSYLTNMWVISGIFFLVLGFHVIKILIVDAN